MLRSYQHGFAVIGSKSGGISFEDSSLEICKKYCKSGSVIVRISPRICGFRFTFRIMKPWKLIKFDRYGMSNILWFYFDFSFEYKAHYGEIVFTPITQPNDQH